MYLNAPVRLKGAGRESSMPTKSYSRRMPGSSAMPARLQRCCVGGSNRNQARSEQELNVDQGGVE